MLKENYDGNNCVSLTHPETLKIHMKDYTIKFAYLLQTVVDIKTGLILMQQMLKIKLTDTNEICNRLHN